jgi:ketosteroid isomerase-like protein
VKRCSAERGPTSTSWTPDQQRITPTTARCAASGERIRLHLQPGQIIMSASDNRKIVEHIFSETANGNWQSLLESLADDFRFIVTGSSKWARSYDGKAAVLTELFAPLRAKLQQKIINAPVRITAEGNIVVVESRGRNTTTEGKAYNNFYCNVLRLEGGKLKEWTEYADSALVNAVLGDPKETLTGAVSG